MAKGKKPKNDFKKTSDPRPDEQDDLSPVDKGKDYIKPGERA